MSGGFEHERKPGLGGFAGGEHGGHGTPGKRSLVDGMTGPKQATASAEAEGTGAGEGATGSIVARTPTEEANRNAQLIDRASGADPLHGGPAAFPAASTATPQQRHDAALARRTLIDTSIAGEDTTTGRTSGQTKDDAVPGRETVAHQLEATGTRSAAIAAEAASTTALGGRDPATAVQAFETAVRAYQDAYERTYLVSTDRPVDATTRWEANENRDRLSNRSARAKLVRWATQPYIKFVVPARRPDDVYVGIEPLSHAEIAEDNARTAGIMRISTNPLRVVELENASGGYRPGPLRNAIVLSRLADLGFVQDDLAGTAVDHRPDGSYTNSRIRPATR